MRPRFDPDERVRNCFDYLSPKNPLKRLSSRDRRLLVGLVGIYLGTETNAEKEDRRGRVQRKKQPSSPFAELEDASNTAAEASRLAHRIKHLLLESRVGEVLGPLVPYPDLPLRLQEFADRLSNVLNDLSGKPGHKSKVARTKFLVMASELVRRRTGSHNDEYLAELMQAVSVGPRSRDFSGDMIRKRRERMDKDYNLIYLHALIVVSNIPEVPDTAADLLWRRPSIQQNR